MKKVGVLSLQGGFAKHIEILRLCGHQVISVRNEADLAQCDGLILPGGESTTIAMLIKRRGLDGPLNEFIKSGKAVFGTCAGMILLSHKVDGRNELHFSAIDMEIERNSYGSQVDSFEAALDITIQGKKIAAFPAVFIRAPRITALGDGVQALASFNGDPVMVQSGNIIATSFHPELTADRRIHEYFIEQMG